MGGYYKCIITVIKFALSWFTCFLWHFPDWVRQHLRKRTIIMHLLLHLKHLNLVWRFGASRDLPPTPDIFYTDCSKAMRVGWVKQRCRVSYVTGASNWDWLTVGQGLLSLQQVWIEEECFYSVSSFSFIFLFLPCPFLLCHLLSILSIFSLSLGDDTKWPTKVDV